MVVSVEVRLRHADNLLSLDKAIDAFARARPTGSGFDFATRKRDREYVFKSERAARSAALRISLGLKRQGRRCRVRIQ